MQTKTHLQVTPQHSQSRERFLPSADAQRRGGSSPKGAKELTVFAVIAGAAHSVTHAAFSALPAGQADLRRGAPSAGGTRAVLVCAALLILHAGVWLREGGRKRMRHLGIQGPALLNLDAHHSSFLPKSYCRPLLPNAVSKCSPNRTHSVRSTPFFPDDTSSGTQRSQIPHTLLTW